ncbi:MAG: hypothetical protein EXQ88_00725 [Alphaproteobacteria bacterium]|nr:hypothetical protein [Alphaproteobacteria bacterium]
MTPSPKPMFGSKQWRFRMLRKVRSLPIHWRVTIGVIFVLGGFMWFLPVLGIWMLPLGLVVLAFDIPFMRRWMRVWAKSHFARWLSSLPDSRVASWLLARLQNLIGASKAAYKKSTRGH